MRKKIRVLVEQRVLAAYRVPFFARLAEEVDLLLLASEGVEIPGVKDVAEDLPFRNLRSIEVKNSAGCAFHKKIFRILKEFEPEVYISTPSYFEPLYMNPIYYLRLRRSGAATVNWSCAGYELHDFVKYRWLRKQRSKIYEHPRGWLQRQLKDFSVHNMDAMITYSEHTSRYWRDVYDITPEKIIIAHNSIDTAPFCQCRQELEKKNVCREPKKILFVGKLTEAKSVDLLLMAYEQIQDRHPGSSLRIIGDGPEKERLRRLSSELMLRNVEFIDGIYNQHELAKQMYPASVFVLPGLGGLGINSAMAMGLPIICSRGDGTEKHLVEHGRNGFIFDSSLTGLVKTLDNALSTPNMLVRMGEKSAELIETRFNLNTMVQAFLFCIERVTKK